MTKMMQWVMVATIMFVYALGIEAQEVMTTDAMICVAEQKTKLERLVADGKRLSPAQQPALTFVVKVADENAADTYARLAAANDTYNYFLHWGQK